MHVQTRRSVDHNLARYVGPLAVALTIGSCPGDASAQPVSTGASVQATLLSDVQALLDNDIPVGVTLGQGRHVRHEHSIYGGQFRERGDSDSTLAHERVRSAQARLFAVVDSPRVVNATSPLPGREVYFDRLDRGSKATAAFERAPLEPTVR
jgi:hypothetical protein